MGTRYVPSLMVFAFLGFFIMIAWIVVDTRQLSMLAGPPPARPTAVIPPLYPCPPPLSCPEQLPCPTSSPTDHVDEAPPPPPPADPIRDALYTRAARDRMAETICHHPSSNQTNTPRGCLLPRDPQVFFAHGRELSRLEIPLMPHLGRGLMDTFEEANVVEFGARSGQYGHYFHLHARQGNYTGFDEAINAETFTLGHVLHAKYRTEQVVFPTTWVLSTGNTRIPEEIYMNNLASNADFGVVIEICLPTNQTEQAILHAMESHGFLYDDETSIFLEDIVSSASIWMVFTRIN